MGLGNLSLRSVHVWEWPRDIVRPDPHLHFEERCGLPDGRTCLHSSSALPFPHRPRTPGLAAGTSPRAGGKEADDSFKAKLALLPLSCRCGKVLNGICKRRLYAFEFFSKLGWREEGCNPNDRVLQSQTCWESLPRSSPHT